MKFISQLLYITTLLYLCGCVQATRLGKAIQHQVVGEHYLQTENFADGEASFREAVRIHPQNPSANYYLGRFLLAVENFQEALPYLEKAAALEPGNGDYRFWLGVAYAENGRPDKERESYYTALAINPEHLQALIYLGHSLLKNKQYEESLALYQRALALWPESPAALYNRALILGILGRSPEEQLAWLEYLSLYPAGSLAQRATDHLNKLADFSYRNHTLGARTLTLAKIRFKPFTDELDAVSLPSLDLVGATAANMGKGTLQVLVYQKNNRELARNRAITIQKYLQDQFPDLQRDRIRISWFPAAEEFTIDGRKLRSDESVRFFLTD